ncbi:hypothetical protein CMEL01_10828 [Colletotrichum melonis]|uniref:Uncharacterized protein n=1 Tax=Colletotrichum melonis TaxID=1209925 RepID=A0AAI9XXL2_9PEZI|nr:hypothetical protein CMEL01_10828 [Colletotrichum melonis]
MGPCRPARPPRRRRCPGSHIATSLRARKRGNGWFCWIICRFRRHPAVIPSLLHSSSRHLGRHYTRAGGFFRDPVDN